MRKIIFAVLCLALLAWPVMADYSYSLNLIATAIAVGAGATKIEVTDFTAVEANISHQGSFGALTVTFTRAAGAADTVDFYFEVSADGGTTWSTFEGTTISVATNHAVISGTTVRATWVIDFGGISHIRLAKVVNNDAVHALTAVNVKVSF